MKTIEWASGLFEGEGCISQASNRPNTFTLEIWSSDYDVIEAFNSIVPYGSVCERAKKREAHHKTMYGWRCFTRDHIREILVMMLPYLGNRRAHKALNCLDTLDNINTTN